MAELDLFALLGRGEALPVDSEIERTRRRVHGVTLGVVTDVDDPQRLGRVKVRLPWISDTVESAWARLAAPWAGASRGAYFVPEVDDEVLVAFRHGDLGFPYVLGALWSDGAPPPEATPRLERRGLRSRSGHELTLDDSAGRGKVTLRSAAGQEIALDDTAGASKVTISGAGGTLTIELDAATSAIKVTAASGNISLSAPSGKVSVDAAAFEVRSSGPVSIQSAATVGVTGSLVKIN
jgi:uncharacterized protein involved in type VI secretion and phage assembly